MHCGLRLEDPLVASFDAWQAEYGPVRWREVLLSSVAEEAIAERIRESTRCGWPLGSEPFVRDLEQRARRRLHPLPPGRPKKENEPETAPLDDQLTLQMGG